jgi:hypothetical protein
MREPAISHVVFVGSDVDLELVDHLAWASGWGLLAGSLHGSKKNYRVDPRGEKIAVCFEDLRMALSFVSKCAVHSIKSFLVD